MDRSRVLPIAFAACACSCLLSAQTVPTGDAFQINQLTTGDQQRPDIAPAPDGGFRVVWHTAASAGDDTDGLSVSSRRFDASGLAVGDEFQVNTYTTYSQRDARIASRRDGSYVVQWRSRALGNKGPLGTLQARSFDDAGAPLGPDFQVSIPANIYTFFTDHDVETLEDANGEGNDFVVVEATYYDNYSSPPFSDVSATVLQPGGTFISGSSVGFGMYPIRTRIAKDPPATAEGAAISGFVVSWVASPYGYSTNYSRTRRLDAGGTATGLSVAPFEDFRYFGADAIDAASTDVGGFVVATDAYDTYDSTGDRLFGRTYDAADGPLAPEPGILTDAGGVPSHQRLARGADGSFLVVWQATGVSGEDGAGIFGRRLSRTGQPEGTQFRIHQITTGDQIEPAVVAVDDGRRFVVTWTAENDQDGEGKGVFARWIDNLGLFHDGFETGETSRWSSAVE